MISEHIQLSAALTKHHSPSVTHEHLHVELPRHGLEPMGITKGMGITKKCNICQATDRVALISD